MWRGGEVVVVEEEVVVVVVVARKRRMISSRTPGSGRSKTRGIGWNRSIRR